MIDERIQLERGEIKEARKERRAKVETAVLSASELHALSHAAATAVLKHQIELEAEEDQRALCRSTAQVMLAQRPLNGCSTAASLLLLNGCCLCLLTALTLCRSTAQYLSWAGEHLEKRSRQVEIQCLLLICPLPRVMYP